MGLDYIDRKRQKKTMSGAVRPSLFYNESVCCVVCYLLREHRNTHVASSLPSWLSIMPIQVSIV